MSARPGRGNQELLMKLDWKRTEKNYYLPGTNPEIIVVPEFGFYAIRGQGNPNDAMFGEYISALYSLSYAIRMSPRQGCAPENYVEYTVYPLEGLWDLTDKGKHAYDGVLDKNELRFLLMMRQPDFVTETYAAETIDRVRKKKPSAFLGEVRFERLREGPCVQMLHIGSYDSEPTSFTRMEAFAGEHNLQRVDKTHREIYLSDPGRVEEARMKTVLRFQVHQ